MRYTLLVGLVALLAGCKKDKTSDGTAGTTDSPPDTTSDDTGTAPVDADGDGYAADVDCDDGHAAIHPDATEVCNTVDDNCDGAVDEGVLLGFYPDGDGDGYGDDAGRIEACEAPDASWVEQGGDCDDASAEVHPDAEEVCDTVDNDCDGDIDEGVATIYYPDADGDGFGDATMPTPSCEVLSGYVLDGGDCDDGLDSVNPDGTELCDGVDDDCDGVVDEDDAADAPTWYYDGDSDGYGDPTFTAVGCIAPSGFVADDQDCDDTLDDVNPAAAEVCGDGLDNDCDGTPNGCMPFGDTSVADADAIFRGVAEGDRLAQGDPGIASAGDLDGDGFGDIVIGAVKEDTAGNMAGAAYFMYGPLSGDTSMADADAMVTGEVERDLAGRAVAGVGDVNDDGFDDVLVSAQGEATNGSSAGAAYLLFGPVQGTDSLSNADAKLTGEAAGDLVADVGWAGDVNGDGVTDMIIGAQWNDQTDDKAGAAYVVYGPISGEHDLSTASVRLYGEAITDEAGSSVWGGGDLDGDGVDDVLVGARLSDLGYEDAGAVYVVTSPAAGSSSLGDAYAIFTGEAAGDELAYGVSVSDAGDVDGDGHPDFLVGARKHTDTLDYQGAAYLVLGPVSAGVQDIGAAASAKLIGEAEKDYTGDSVSGPGDVNGDGHADLLIGSGYSDAGASNGGAAYLVLGPVSGGVSLSDATARFMASGDEDRIRTHAAGDVDGDGMADILVGAQNNSDVAYQAGAAYLFYGGAW